jgi:hypothetical protein
MVDVIAFVVVGIDRDDSGSFAFVVGFGVEYNL